MLQVFRDRPSRVVSSGFQQHNNTRRHRIYGEVATHSNHVMFNVVLRIVEQIEIHKNRLESVVVRGNILAKVLHD
jgi:hypothetical protein